MKKYSITLIRRMTQAVIIEAESCQEARDIVTNDLCEGNVDAKKWEEVEIYIYDTAELSDNG